jgi:hypothetical protein
MGGGGGGHVVVLVVDAHATNQKVVGSSPHEVTEFFNWPNPSSRTMVLGSTQHLTEIRTRNLSGG